MYCVVLYNVDCWVGMGTGKFLCLCGDGDKMYGDVMGIGENPQEWDGMGWEKFMVMILG